jgi:hypothetical protein
MTDRAPSPDTLLERRFALVVMLSGLTARSHKLIQELSAADMDVLRLELETARKRADAELVRELQDVQDRAASLRASQAECQDETAAVEAQMDEIDRLIAAARGETR